MLKVIWKAHQPGSTLSPTFYRLLDLTGGTGRVPFLLYDNFVKIHLHDGDGGMLLRAAEVDGIIRKKHGRGLSTKLAGLWKMPLRYLPSHLRSSERFEVITGMGALGYLTEFDDQLSVFLGALKELGSYLILRESVMDEDSDAHEYVEEPQMYTVRRIDSYKYALATKGWHLVTERAVAHPVNRYKFGRLWYALYCNSPTTPESEEIDSATPYLRFKLS